MRVLKTTLFTMAMMAFISACGARKKVNYIHTSSANELSYLMMDKNCSSKGIVKEPVTGEIVKAYEDFSKRYMAGLFGIIPKTYDYKNPLILNLTELENGLIDFQTKMKDAAYVEKNMVQMSNQIHYLYHGILRFEGQKCAFPRLALKKPQDLRPYLEMRDLCLQKNNREICDPKTVNMMTSEEVAYTDERALKLCTLFNKKVNCNAEHIIKKQNLTANVLPEYYQTRFKNEHFNKLFLLKDSSLKFACQKLDQTTYMNLKVSSIGWTENRELLRFLLDHVTKTWSSDRFKIIFSIVDSSGGEEIEITPTSNGLSYVPDNNNRKIFLMQTLTVEEKKSILAHEFGHVLGFPDCYTEFFDRQKNSLIYYEMSHENTNIMCSMKNGVSVPENYFQQLEQKSCLFN